MEHIRIAKEDGDLSENAGYDAAKNEQSFVEGRIMTLEVILKNAQIIENNGYRDTVALGCRVTVQEDGYEPETFQIVGSTEADPSQERISNESPRHLRARQRSFAAAPPPGEARNAEPIEADLRPRAWRPDSGSAK